MAQVFELMFVQAFVSELSVNTPDEAILHPLPGRRFPCAMSCHSTLRSSCHLSMAFDVSSVTSSEMGQSEISCVGHGVEDFYPAIPNLSSKRIANWALATPHSLAGIMGRSMGERTTEIYAEYDAGYLKSAVDAIDNYMTEVLGTTFAYPARARKGV